MSNLDELRNWLNDQIDLHARLLENQNAPSQSRSQWEGAIVAYKETLVEVEKMITPHHEAVDIGRRILTGEDTGDLTTALLARQIYEAGGVSMDDAVMAAVDILEA